VRNLLLMSEFDHPVRVKFVFSLAFIIACQSYHDGGQTWCSLQNQVSVGRWTLRPAVFADSRSSSAPSRPASHESVVADIGLKKRHSQNTARPLLYSMDVGSCLAAMLEQATTHKCSATSLSKTVRCLTYSLLVVVYSLVSL
jgi:hypothetical protein